MKTKFEEKDEITVEEYKAWLAGFMYGGDTPNKDDVALIIKMTDKIVPEVREVQNPYIAPIVVPYTPVTDEPAPWWETQPTCTDDIEYLNGITITSGTTSMEFKDSGDITINGHAGLTLNDSYGAPVPTSGIVISDEAQAQATYGCYGSSNTSCYAPPQQATFCSPHMMLEDNESAARDILNKIRERSKGSVVTNNTSLSAKERLVKVKKRLQE